MSEALLEWCWRTFVNGGVAIVLLGTWMRILGLSHGRTRRRILLLILALPPLIALLPKSEDPLFDLDLLAWMPVIGPLRGWHCAAVVGLTCTVVTLWQEIVPPLRRGGLVTMPPSAELARTVAGLSVQPIELLVVEDDRFLCMTEGGIRRRRLILSSGAVERLDPLRLETVVRHELAHWDHGRWWASHLAWLVRIVQLPSPFALWAFRELMVEQEILCDAQAVQATGESSAPELAATLLEIYERSSSMPRRAVVRRRVDVLLGRMVIDDHALSLVVVAVAAGCVVGVLAWLG